MPPKKKASAAAAAAAPQEDVSMADASSPAGMPEPEDDMMIDEQRIRIVSLISYGWF
jgi:DNA-directed RNA polymerases I and III subunit RPAC2